MYDYHEKERAPDLESILADFMAYHASSKANQNSMKNHEIHFGKSYSIETFKGDQSYNLDKLLMLFKETTKSIQRALQSVEI